MKKISANCTNECNIMDLIRGLVGAQVQSPIIGIGQPGYNGYGYNGYGYNGYAGSYGCDPCNTNGYVNGYGK